MMGNSLKYLAPGRVHTFSYFYLYRNQSGECRAYKWLRRCGRALKSKPQTQSWTSMMGNSLEYLAPGRAHTFSYFYLYRNQSGYYRAYTWLRRCGRVLKSTPQTQRWTSMMGNSLEYLAPGRAHTFFYFYLYRNQ